MDFKSNLFKIDKKLNVIDGTRTGLKLKAELLYTTEGKELRGVTLDRGGKMVATSYDDYLQTSPKIMKRYQQEAEYMYYDKQTSSIFHARHGKVSGMVIDMGNTVKTKPVSVSYTHLTLPTNREV